MKVDAAFGNWSEFRQYFSCAVKYHMLYLKP